MRGEGTGVSTVQLQIRGFAAQHHQFSKSTITNLYCRLELLSVGVTDIRSYRYPKYVKVDRVVLGGPLSDPCLDPNGTGFKVREV